MIPRVQYSKSIADQAVVGFLRKKCRDFQAAVALVAAELELEAAVAALLQAVALVGLAERLGLLALVAE